MSSALDKVEQNLFKIQSENFKNNDIMPINQVYNGHGTNGNNLSPQLSWSGYPENTKSFAIVCHDPDAPKDHGWYHWFLVNIPLNVTSLKEGEKLKNADELITDFNIEGYNGAAPPKGHGIHHYNFTVYAINKEHLDISNIKNKAPYLIEEEIIKNSIAKTTITALYQR